MPGPTQAPQAESHPLPDPFLRLTVADVPCAPPVFVHEGDSVAQAARAMAAAGATAALVLPASPPASPPADAPPDLSDGLSDSLAPDLAPGLTVVLSAGLAADRANTHPGTPNNAASLGIITERDVLVRVVAAGKNAESLPVAQAMTKPLLTARQGDLLIEAFSRMVRHGVRRLVLLDEAGFPLGLLGEGDMLAARGESPLALAAEINTAQNESALARAFERLARLAARSVAEGIGSEAVGRLISLMHDRIMSQAWGLALEQTHASLGPPPARHAVFLLGSQARREQYLATDQDLALVYETPAPGQAAEVDAWFAALGERLTRLLLALGFPPCPKRIMLDNPHWRRSRDAWLDLADAIAERPDADGVVTASLLADLRPLHAPNIRGDDFRADANLGLALRLSLDARFRAGALLLKCMAREAVRFAPPLGLFRGFTLKKDGDGRGSVDLKRGGVFPITQGAKVLALRHGLEHTGTLERLRALAKADILPRTLAEGLCEACAFLQTLRMRAQARALSLGEAPGNALRPDDLTKAEAERLRAAFKLVVELQDLLSGAFALHLLG